MDEKLKSTIDKIVQLSKQNPEFDTELRKRLEITSSANYALVEDERNKNRMNQSEQAYHF